MLATRPTFSANGVAAATCADGVASSTCEPPLTEPEIVAAAMRMRLAAGGGAGVRLLPRLLDPCLTLEALARMLGAEPALATRVLRVANAPYYGQAGHVATLARATRLLGLDALRGIAAAACFDSVNLASLRQPAPDAAAFRRHSLAGGMAVQALARRVAPDLAEEAFIAGLLHDLGLLMLWRLRPGTMAAQASHPETTTSSGIDHADCGRLLMQTWSLPATLCTAIAQHEHGGDDSPGARPNLTGLLRMGHALAIGAGFGLADEAATPVPACPAGWQAACTELAASLPQEVERLVTAFAD